MLQFKDLTQEIRSHLVAGNLAYALDAVDEGMRRIATRKGAAFGKRDMLEFLIDATATACLAKKPEQAMRYYRLLTSHYDVRVGNQSLLPERHPRIAPIITWYHNRPPTPVKTFLRKVTARVSNWLDRHAERLDKLEKESLAAIYWQVHYRQSTYYTP